MHTVTQYAHSAAADAARLRLGRIAPLALARGEGDGRWITIGAQEGEDGKRHGGAHVFIGAGGKIKKGPGHMVGMTPAEVASPHSPHPEAKDAKEHARNADHHAWHAAEAMRRGDTKAHEHHSAEAEKHAASAEESKKKPAKVEPVPHHKLTTHAQASAEAERLADASGAEDDEHESARLLKHAEAAQAHANKLKVAEGAEKPATKAEPVKPATATAHAGPFASLRSGMIDQSVSTDKAVDFAVHELANEKHARSRLVPKSDLRAYLKQVAPHVSDEQIDARLGAYSRGDGETMPRAEHGSDYVHVPNQGAMSAKGLKVAAPSSDKLRDSVLAHAAAIHKERAAKGNNNDLVPIHEIRSRVAAEHGPHAARHDVLDHVLREIHQSGGGKLLSISDTRGQTADELNAGIHTPHGHSTDTKAYLELPNKDKARQELARLAPLALDRGLSPFHSTAPRQVTGKHGDLGHYLTLNHHLVFITDRSGHVPPRLKAEGGRRFSRKGLEREMVDAYKAQGGDEHLDAMHREASEHIAGHAFKFPHKLPAEVQGMLEGRPHLKPLFQVETDPHKIGGALGNDALSHFGDDKYLDYAEAVVGNPVEAAKRFAKKHDDPSLNFLAALHDHLPDSPGHLKSTATQLRKYAASEKAQKKLANAAQLEEWSRDEKIPQKHRDRHAKEAREIRAEHNARLEKAARLEAHAKTLAGMENISPGQLRVGDVFTVGGTKLAVAQDHKGHRVLKGGSDFPDAPPEAIEHMQIPIDAGSFRPGRVRVPAHTRWKPIRVAAHERSLPKKPNDAIPFSRLAEMRMNLSRFAPLALSAGLWDEHLHPRAADGEWTSKGAGGRQRHLSEVDPAPLDAAPTANDDENSDTHHQAVIDQEVALAKSLGVDVRITNHRPKKFRGKYHHSRKLIEVFAGGRDKKGVADTVLHEVGHLLDYHRRGIVPDPFGDSVIGYDGKLRPAGDGDIYFRDNRSEEAKRIRQAHGRHDGLGNTQKEIYADAYKMLRRTPEKLKEVAPRIYREVSEHLAKIKARHNLSRLAPLALSANLFGGDSGTGAQHHLFDGGYWRTVRGRAVHFTGTPGHGIPARLTPTGDGDHALDFSLDAMHAHQETGPERRREHNISLAHRYDLAGKRGDHAIYRDKKSGKHFLEVKRHGDTHVTLEHTPDGPAEHEIIRPAATHVNAHKDLFGNDRAIEQHEGIFGEGTLKPATLPSPPSTGEVVGSASARDPKHTAEMFADPNPAQSAAIAKSQAEQKASIDATKGKLQSRGVHNWDDLMQHAMPKEAELLKEGLAPDAAKEQAMRYAAEKLTKIRNGEKKVGEARDKLAALAPDALKVKARGPATATGDESGTDARIDKRETRKTEADMGRVHAEALKRVKEKRAKLAAMTPDAMSAGIHPAIVAHARGLKNAFVDATAKPPTPATREKVYGDFKGGDYKAKYGDVAAKRFMNAIESRDTFEDAVHWAMGWQPTEKAAEPERAKIAPSNVMPEFHTTMKREWQKHKETHAKNTTVPFSRVYLSLAPTMADNTTEYRAEKTISLGGAVKSIPVTRLKKDVLAPGSYVHPLTGQAFTVTPEDIDGFVDKFRLMREAGIEIPVPVDHKMNAEANRGFVVDAEKRNGRLCLTHEMIGEDAILLAARNRASVLIDPNYRDEFGKSWGKCIVHSALTPIPVISGMGQFQPAA